MSDKKNAPRLGKGLSMLIGGMPKAVPITPPASPPAAQTIAPVVSAPVAPSSGTTPVVSKHSVAPAGKTALGSVVTTKSVTLAPAATAPSKPTPAAHAMVPRGTSAANVQVPVSDVPRGTGETILYLEVGLIKPNPNQPRQRFAEAPLKQLSESIQRDGIMQPILVRKGAEPGQYELVAGERRWRAAQMAGLAVVPALLRTLSEEQSAEWALVENLQREDLGAMEKAESLDRLAKKFSLTHQTLAEKLGLDRTTVTNLLRLLTLEAECRKLIEEGHLSMSHAKALASITDHGLQRATAKRAVQEGWSVRRMETEVQRIVAGTRAPAVAHTPAGKAAATGSHLEDLEKQIARQLGLRATIRQGKKKGTGHLVLSFSTLDQFDALLERMRVQLD